MGKIQGKNQKLEEDLQGCIMCQREDSNLAIESEKKSVDEGGGWMKNSQQQKENEGQRLIEMSSIVEQLQQHLFDAVSTNKVWW